MRILTISFYGLVFVLASCGSRKNNKSVFKADGGKTPSAFLVQKASSTSVDINNPIAFEIPAPLDARLIETHKVTNGLILLYRSPLSQYDILHFFQIQMERFGWFCSSSLVADTACVVFEKPNRRCVLALRKESRSQMHYTLFISDKI